MVICGSPDFSKDTIKNQRIIERCQTSKTMQPYTRLNICRVLFKNTKVSFWYVNLKEFCIPKHFRHNRSHASVHIFSDFKYNASFLFNAILSPWVCLYCLISCPGFQPKLYIQRAIKTQSKSCTFALVGQIELSGQQWKFLKKI